jgi:Cys-tRNA(Pro)/Cys-tRNA(Cys) deacylase
MSTRRAPTTAATQALDRAGIPYRTRTYDNQVRHDFGAEAAQTLGEDGDRVFKTLVADAHGTLVIGVVPVSGHLDLKALAACVGQKKASLCDPAVAQRKTGYVVGGISPIGVKTRIPVVLDASALRHDAILLSGGRRGFDIEIAPADLLAVTEGSTAAIAAE